MDEPEARAALERMFDVPRETMARLDLFDDLLREANETQNLVAARSLDTLWQRHFLDSAQLLRFAPNREASWVDLGSGAGFPGLVVALLHKGPVTLIEERRLRIEFLRRAADALDLTVEIIAPKVERVEPRPFDVRCGRIQVGAASDCS